MGDTVIPVKAFIQKEEAVLHYFRGALLSEYRRALDDLFVRAETQVAAITMAEHLALLVSLMSDVLQLQERIHELERGK